MFKKLKSLFVVDEGGSSNSSASPQKTNTPAEKSNPQAAVNQSTAANEKPQYDKNNPPKGQPSEKFINRLLGAIEEHNVKGFDYLEYKQSLQNLSGVEMDEETKYKSALAMAKTMGATPQKMIDSANHYIKVLNNEETKFMDAFKNQQTLQVNNRNSEIKKLEDTIVLKQQKIEQLTKEIEEHKKALEQRKASINQAHAKVQATKTSFYHAYHIVVQQIQDDVDKMKKYLS